MDIRVLNQQSEKGDTRCKFLFENHSIYFFSFGGTRGAYNIRTISKIDLLEEKHNARTTKTETVCIS